MKPVEKAGEILSGDKVTESRAARTPEGEYYIQVGSFTVRENAEALAERLRSGMYKVVIEEARIHEKDFNRVWVGPFSKGGVAVNTMISMKNRYDLKDAFVLEKSAFISRNHAAPESAGSPSAPGQTMPNI